MIYHPPNGDRPAVELTDLTPATRRWLRAARGARGTSRGKVPPQHLQASRTYRPYLGRVQRARS